jgi:PAS domain S-box-containing protein
MQAHDHGVEAVHSFLPHGYCYLWNPPLLWTHVLADVLIGLAYVAIGSTLVMLVVRGRREFPFQAMFLAFGLFIVACGATHFVEVYTLWTPAYWFSAAVKVVTAGASVGTAMLLPPLVPRVLHTVRAAKLAEDRRVQAESAGRFRALTEGMPQIVWTARADGEVDYYNDRWFDYTGITTAGGRGSGWIQVLHPDDEVLTAAAWADAVARGTPYEVEHRIRGADGAYRWFLSRGIPTRDARGAVNGWIGSATDIDAQKQTAAELRRAKEAAEAANLAKDRFLAVMSHELRTPLNGVVGYVDLMEAGVGGTLSAGHKDYAVRIRTATEHLRGVIDQVLTMARDDAGRSIPATERVRVGAIVREVVEMTEPLADARGVAMRIAESDADAELELDAGALRQVLLNLVGNAIKFTEHGYVELGATTEDGQVLLSVRDTGPGIAPEHLDQVFEPFWQADQSHTRRAEGTGLGLSVARRLARALGGEIVVDSTPGRGSTFTVRLPLHRTPRG